MANDESVNQPPGGDTPPEKAGTNWDEWAAGAGIDPSNPGDPADHAAALDFYRKHGTEEEIFTAKDFETKMEERLAEKVQDPETHKQLEEYFKQRLQNEGWKVPGTTEPEPLVTAGEDGQPVLDEPRMLDSVQKRLQPKMQQLEQAVLELTKEREERKSAASDQEWASNFRSSIAEAVKRHSNGVIPQKRLEKELRRRYVSRENSDTSPQGLAQAVKGLVQEKLQERQEDFGALGIDLNQLESSAVDQSDKVEDILMDDDKFDAVAERLLSNGLPRSPSGD